MARGINKVILIGHVGREPEIRQPASGQIICTVSLATSAMWKDRQTGEKQERTEWHRVICFGRLAEIARDYIHKGTRLYVEGSLRTQKWQDQQGNDRYTTEIIAADLQMLDSKSGTATNYEHPATSNAAAEYSGKKNKTASPETPQDVFAEIDDDIPF